MRSISARPAGINQYFAGGWDDGHCVPPQYTRKCRDLFRCFPLHSEGCQERTNLRLRCGSLHDPAHHHGRLLSGEILPVDEAVYALLDIHDTTPAGKRKFPIMRSPSLERMLSGWNWMPSIGNRVWRTPMTYPSSRLDAVTSSSGGRDSLSTIRE